MRAFKLNCCSNITISIGKLPLEKGEYIRNYHILRKQ